MSKQTAALNCNDQTAVMAADPTQGTKMTQRMPHLTVVQPNEQAGGADQAQTEETESTAASEALKAQLRELPDEERLDVLLHGLSSLAEPELLELSVRLSDALKQNIPARVRRSLALALCLTLGTADRLSVLSRLKFDLPPLQAAWRKASRREQKELLAYVGMESACTRKATAQMTADGTDPLVQGVVDLGNAILAFSQNPGSTPQAHDSVRHRLSEQFVRVLSMIVPPAPRRLSEHEWRVLRQSCATESERRVFAKFPAEGESPEK